MATKKESEAAGKDEGKLLEMVAAVNAMVLPVLERASLERFATAAMQGLLEGDVRAAVGDPASLAVSAWDIAEAMAVERIKRGQAELEAMQRELMERAGELTGAAGAAGAAVQ